MCIYYAQACVFWYVSVHVYASCCVYFGVFSTRDSKLLNVSRGHFSFLPSRIALLSFDTRLMASRSPSPSFESHAADTGDGNAEVAAVALVAEMPPSDLARTAAAEDAERSLDSVLSIIADRRDAGEFPLVLPSHVGEASRKQAADALEMVQVTDRARVEGYMRAKCEAFRQNLPATDTRAERVILAEWAYRYYYFHLDAWNAQHGNIPDGSFVPSVAPELLPEAKRTFAQSLLAQLHPIDWVSLGGVIRHELDEFLAVLPDSMCEQDWDIAVDAWYTDNYYDLMASVLADRPRASFKPMLALDEVPLSQREVFEGNCFLLCAADEKPFHVSVNAEWEIAWAKMPTHALINRREDIKLKWLGRNYPSMLVEYVRSLGCKKPRWILEADFTANKFANSEDAHDPWMDAATDHGRARVTACLNVESSIDA